MSKDKKARKFTSDEIEKRLAILVFCRDELRGVLSDSSNKGSVRTSAIEEYKNISFEILELENTNADEGLLLKELQTARKEIMNLKYQISLWVESYGDVFGKNTVDRGPLLDTKPTERSPSSDEVDTDNEGLHIEVNGVETGG